MRTRFYCALARIAPGVPNMERFMTLASAGMRHDLHSARIKPEINGSRHPPSGAAGPLRSAARMGSHETGQRVRCGVVRSMPQTGACTKRSLKFASERSVA